LRSYGGLKSQDVEKIFSSFLKNDTLRENLQNFVPKGFIATPIDVLCSNFVKFSRQEIGEIMRCVPDKNLPCSPALASVRIAPKICQSQPQTMYSESSRFHPNRFTFGGVIPERDNIVRSRSKVNPISNIRLKPSFEPNNKSHTADRRRADQLSAAAAAEAAARRRKKIRLRRGGVRCQSTIMCLRHGKVWYIWDFACRSFGPGVYAYPSSSRDRAAIRR